jgi:hypothetical protein
VDFEDKAVALRRAARLAAIWQARLITAREMLT